MGLFLIATFFLHPSTRSQNREIVDIPAGKTVRAISFKGKFKVKTYLLYREIDTKLGQFLDSARIRRDQKKIDGLGIFSEVRPEFFAAGDSVDIVFHLTEIWTLIPLISAGQSDGSFDWLVGAHERDLAGLLGNVRGFYRRFEGENSYVIDIVLPRTLGRDLSLGISLAREQQKDPIWVDTVVTNNRYLSKSASVSLGFRVSETVYPGVFFGYQRENWQLLPDSTTPPAAPRVLDYPRYNIGGSFSLGRIYSDHFYFDGAQLSAGATLIRELPGHRFDKWRLQISGRSFTVKHGINFCARLQYARSSADERISPYGLSGSSNVRGFRDNSYRGDHFLGGNLEARRKLIETKRWYSQAALFVDAASIWGRNRDATNALNDPYWSFGGGLRLAFKKWPRLGRADLIYNTSTGSWTYYFSSSQFF